ncbi:MAG: matrixin family metalloprotease, partial [Pseudolabrys sp.]
MTATASVSPTGDPYVDSLLTGIKWGDTNLTYSFPSSPSYYVGTLGFSYGSEPATNFKAFTAVQQAAVTSILKMDAAVANVTFTEITETSTSSATIRYAESDAALPTAYTYEPSTAPQGGDAWFSNSSHYYDNPVVGNYAWFSMIHETGHALGLKHPFQTSGSFGIMPADHDTVEYTVMTYISYAGGSTSGYTNASDSYPQSLMMYDIAALQSMYGANY